MLNILGQMEEPKNLRFSGEKPSSISHKQAHFQEQCLNDPAYHYGVPGAKTLFSIRTTQLTVRRGDPHIVKRDEVRALHNALHWLLFGQSASAALAHRPVMISWVYFFLKRCVVGVLDVGSQKVQSTK